MRVMYARSFMDELDARFKCVQKSALFNVFVFADLNTLGMLIYYQLLSIHA